MIYLQLFWEFFKTGLFAVGGGLATLPFLEDVATRTGWYTTTQLADFLAMSECTPGPIGINVATYVGFQTAGVPGAVVAVTGEVLPSLLIILAIARVLARYRHNTYVNAAFNGLRPASVGMIIAAWCSMANMSVISVEKLFAGDILGGLSLWGIPLAAAVFILVRKTKLHPVFLLLGCAAIGIAMGALGWI